MKKVLLLALALTVCAAGASMADHIGIYSDNAGTSCYHAPGQALVPLYVIHKFNPGATASEFQVLDTAPSIHLGEVTTAPFLLIGGYYTGASVAYTACVTGDIVVATLNTFGSPTPCGKETVVADPTATPPVLGVVDCGGSLKNVTGGSFFWGDPACGPCGEVATKASTWGTIKALYR